MMPASRLELLDPFLAPTMADRVARLGWAAAPYHMYVEAPRKAGLGAGLVRRHDAVMGHVQRSLSEQKEPSLEELFARTNLFREIYAENDEIRVPGCEALLMSETLLDGARRISGLDVVQPTMLYANVLLPGQELALHTDTPHYRGIDKTTQPEWLMVVMAHSGLFERWRIRVAAAVAFFGSCEGGELVVYADGPQAPPTKVPPRDNTAVLIDADGLFHGVARVGGPDAPAPPIKAGMQVESGPDMERWSLRCDGAEVVSYAADEVRLSMQWKALCFANEDECRLVGEHEDDLTFEMVRATLLDDLRERGRVPGPDPDDTALALLMIEEYVQFPA